MAIKITSIDEAVQDTGIKVLVHGLAGSGKTVLSATTGDRCLMISAEAGLLSIKGAPAKMGVTIIKTTDELEDVLEHLVKGDHGFETIILDSISEIAEVTLSDEKASSKDPRAAYGNMQDDVSRALRAFRDLPHLNVVMTCKQARLVDESTGLVTFGPLLPGRQLPQSVGYLFDEVFALRVMKDPDTKEDIRVLQTSRDVQFEAKDRSGKLDIFEPANLKHIFDKIREPDSDETAPDEEEEKEVYEEEEVIAEPDEPEEDPDT